MINDAVFDHSVYSNSCTRSSNRLLSTKKRERKIFAHAIELLWGLGPLSVITNNKGMYCVKVCIANIIIANKSYPAKNQVRFAHIMYTLFIAVVPLMSCLYYYLLFIMLFTKLPR